MKSNSRLKSVFETIGLTQYESQVYQALLKHGRLHAKDIATYSGVPPTAVYPNVQSLISQQLVQVFQGQISEYEAIAPAQALKQFVRLKQDSLSTQLTRAMKTATTLRQSRPVVKNPEIIAVTKGETNEYYHELVSQTKQTFFVLGWKFQKVGRRLSYLEFYRELRKRNVDVRFILQKGKISRTLHDAFTSLGVKIRTYPLTNISMAISDFSQCKISLQRDVREDKLNLQIKDEALAIAMGQYFLTVWDKADEVTEFDK